MGMEHEHNAIGKMREQTGFAECRDGGRMDDRVVEFAAKVAKPVAQPSGGKILFAIGNENGSRKQPEVIENSGGAVFQALAGKNI